jgi:hypothetical protein
LCIFTTCVPPSRRSVTVATSGSPVNIIVSVIRNEIINLFIKGLAALVLSLQTIEIITESVNKLSVKVEVLAVNI